MAEIELSALSKQCLGRRIADIAILSKEIYALAKERNRDKVNINWQFTKNNARDKFSSQYMNIRKSKDALCNSLPDIGL